MAWLGLPLRMLSEPGREGVRRLAVLLGRAVTAGSGRRTTEVGGTAVGAWTIL
jgi:hypothetical protein